MIEWEGQKQHNSNLGTIYTYAAYLMLYIERMQCMDGRMADVRDCVRV